MRVRRMAMMAAATLGASALVPAAQAQDFFSALFGGLSRGRAPYVSMPFANDEGSMPAARSARYGGGQVFCVRTCDGRYFPITASDNASKAASCSSFCPASETRIVYGSNIDNATTETGKSYSELPNAFRYRNEIVAGCTCNGKDQVGLAPVRIEDDPTLRKGDIVASENGLQVVSRSDRRGASLTRLRKDTREIRAHAGCGTGVS